MIQVHFLLLLTLPFLIHALNPVQKPIVQGSLKVYTKKVAQLPWFGFEPARIISMVPQGSTLYVCTLNLIYSISSSGQVSEFFNVGNAISSATGRNLNYANKMHGGVRGLAFHPNFNSNGLLYIAAMEDRPSNPGAFKYVSDTSSPIAADSVILEFKMDKSTGKPNPLSYRNVLRVGMPVYDHPVKEIRFNGPFLYIAHGDGSVQDAYAGGGQNSDALGKILRINPLQKGSQSYTIPSSNPFVNNPSMISEVWALGFRNPHTICFGKDGTLYVGDAGRSNVEEINIAKAGANYGWSAREGTFVHTGGGLMSGVQNLPADDAKFGYVYPVAQVGHEGNYGDGYIGQALAGGCPVENGSGMSGNYFYADFPKTGKLFYSKISDLKNAKTKGSPGQLSQATTFQATIFYDHDGNPGTPPLQFATLGDAMRSEPGLGGQERVDVRFGRGSKGELYWSSKNSGSVYLFTNSL